MNLRTVFMANFGTGRSFLYSGAVRLLESEMGLQLAPAAAVCEACPVSLGLARLAPGRLVVASPAPPKNENDTEAK